MYSVTQNTCGINWGAKKYGSSLLDFLVLTGKNPLRVGAATLQDQKSLLVPLHSNLVLGDFQGLADLGLPNYLLDSNFAAVHKLLFWITEPCPLTLIDGIVNQIVDQIITLPIQLTCGYSHTPKFFVTHLDGSSPLVLGHNWLQTHNPRIN